MCVCCWLVNFQPVLIPPPLEGEEGEGVDVEEYFMTFYSFESDYDAASELSDDDI